MKKALKSLLFLCLATAGHSTNQQALQDHEAAFGNFYKDLSTFLGDATQRAAGFMTGAHAFSPNPALGKFHFNLGVDFGLGFTPIDKSGAEKQANGNQDLIKGLKQLPDALPVPVGGINAHLGLPSLFFFESFDLGLRLHGLGINGSGVEISLSDLGLDLRGNIFESGLASPVNLSLVLGLDRSNNSIKFASAQSISDKDSYPGATIAGSVTSTVDMQMTDTAVSLAAIVSRKFAIVTPYFGVQAQMHNGSADTSLGYKGTVTATGGGGPVAVGTGVSGSSNSPISGVEIRLGGGLQVGMGPVYLAFNGEYGVVSAGYGGSAQFGVKF